MSSDHVDQIRNQFTRQAQAYADTTQAKVLAEMARLTRRGGREDETGLDVREENGEIRFTHQTLVLVGRR